LREKEEVILVSELNWEIVFSSRALTSVLPVLLDNDPLGVECVPMLAYISV
jgi:hypothetical protein